MSAISLLAKLRALNIRIWAEEERLRYSAPKGVLTDDLRAELLEHKVELLTLLSVTAAASSVPGSIEKVPRDQPLLLSFAQQRLWFLDQMVPDNPSYNISSALLLKDIDVSALERALNEIIRRHDSFRTSFMQQANGQPVQIIAPTLNLSLPIIDLRGLPENQRREEAERIAYEEFKRPFDLTRSPLLRVRLLHMMAEEYIFLAVMHHIISDGWSMDILFRELPLIYAAFTRAKLSPLHDLPIQYADFAVWQRGWLKGTILEAQISYWKAQLADLPILKLPTARRRPALPTFRGAYHRLKLPDDAASELEALGLHEGCTLFMALMATFNVLLYRYTGQEDLVVGIPIAGRDRVETEGIIGFFVNTLILRTRLDGGLSFRDLLHRVREVALGAFAHQDLPFEKLVEELQPERDLSRNPLCQVTFQLWHADHEGRDPVGPSGQTLNVDVGTAIFDLALRLWQSPQGIDGGIEYSTDLFDAEMIQRFADHYLTILEQVAVRPDDPISSFSLLDARQTQQILYDWNNTTVQFDAPDCLHRLFEAQAQRTPDRIAVVFGDYSLTFEQLDRRSNQLAHQLRTEGVERDVLIGVCMERSLEMVVAILGVLKAGGAYVPLDPTYPPERLAFMIEDSRAPLLLTQERLLDSLPRDSMSILCLDRDWHLIAQQPDTSCASEVSGANLAYVIYTSGSTGKPKGVLIPHSAICNHMRWMQSEFPLDEDDRVLQRTPFSFDASVWEFYAPLLAGARLVMARTDLHADSDKLIDAIQRCAITVIQLVPSLLRLALNDNDEGLAHCRSLRRVFCGGEALPVEVVQHFFACVEAELVNLYGPTEATIDTTFWRCSPNQERESVPIGKPIANVRLYILDHQKQPVPIGAPGELFIGGAGLARGYLNRPELTAERFIRDPLSSKQDERLYRTGDLVRYAQVGSVEFLGRVDHQIKLRGYRIELGEIEAVLSHHPGVLGAGVTVRGENGTQQLVAYVSRKQSVSHGEASNPQQDDREQITKWQEVYDEIIYAPNGQQSAASVDATFNTVGWNSSFTGSPLSVEEMREWRDQTVELITAWQPERILEIGCGTGMLLFKLASHCQEITATDFSREAIGYLQAHLASRNGNGVHIHLLNQEAERFDNIASQYYDAVILNSVIQYFPSVDYLLRVLEGAVRSAAPGGIVFVGDVRSLPLLEALRTSIEVAHAPKDLSGKDLQQMIRQRIAEEEELVLAPEFFAALKQRFPRISHVQVQPKLGRYDNELSRFRYDVILHVDRAFASPSAEYLDWLDTQLTPAHVEQILIETQPEQLYIRRIPNARLSAETRSAARLREENPDAGYLQEMLVNSVADGITPFDLAALANKHGYRAAFRLTLPSEEGRFDARLVPADSPVAEPFVVDDLSGSRAWSDYANVPIAGISARRFVADLRQYTQTQLPEYMVPSAFVLMDDLPLTPNGKLNREALPQSDQRKTAARSLYVQPRTPVEKKLAAIWGEVLGYQNVGAGDNFFDLGGHSLLAAQVAARVRSAFRVDFPLRHIFLTPRLMDLALRVEEMLIEDIETNFGGL